jgi:hypothetical protein
MRTMTSHLVMLGTIPALLRASLQVDGDATEDA